MCFLPNPRLASDEQRRRAELADERWRRYAGDRSELGDEMRLVVVAGCSGDARPARASIVASRAQRALEARELGERFGAHADRFTEYATEVPFAHPELDGDSVYLRTRESSGGCEREVRVALSPVRGCEAFSDRLLQDRSRTGRVVGVGEPRAQLPRRGATPKIFERDDARGQGRGGSTEHRVRHAQSKARSHRPLPAAHELAKHRLSSAESVYVETPARRRPEADHEMDFWTRDRNAGTVAVAVADEQRCYRGSRRGTRRDPGGASDAGVHRPMLSGCTTPRKLPSVLVRFFQAATGAGA